jgi:carbon-monoxide dehydrogenase medium subunit
MRDFAVGLMSSCLAPNEMLTSVRFTPWHPHCGFAFVEYGRRHGDFAIVSAAVLVEIDAEGKVLRSSLTLGGVGHVPFRLTAGEHLLQGRVVDAAAIEQVCAEAGRSDAMADPAYPAWYRQRLAARLLERALRRALERARPVSTESQA